MDEPLSAGLMMMSGYLCSRLKVLIWDFPKLVYCKGIWISLSWSLRCVRGSIISSGMVPKGGVQGDLSINGNLFLFLEFLKK